MTIGTGVTAGLFLLTMALSLPLGLGLTLLCAGKNRAVKAAAGFYILIMRGTPLLLQMFFIFFGLPKVARIGPYLTFGRFESCAVAFTLNYAAYFAEIFRGGLLSVDKGQYEAAKVLGMSKAQTFARVIMPQMLRIALPAISNEAIILVKDTSLMIAIGVSELLSYTKSIVNTTANISYYAAAALVYLLMSWALTMFFRWLEAKFKME
jgi:polar amino acid transport system permease protein